MSKAPRVAELRAPVNMAHGGQRVDELRAPVNMAQGGGARHGSTLIQTCKPRACTRIALPVWFCDTRGRMRSMQAPSSTSNNNASSDVGEAQLDVCRTTPLAP